MPDALDTDAVRENPIEDFERARAGLPAARLAARPLARCAGCFGSVQQRPGCAFQRLGCVVSKQSVTICRDFTKIGDGHAWSARSSCAAETSERRSDLLVACNSATLRFVEGTQFLCTGTINAGSASLDLPGQFGELLLVLLRPSLDPAQYLSGCFGHAAIAPGFGTTNHPRSGWWRALALAPVPQAGCILLSSGFLRCRVWHADRTVDD